jgi:tRNA-specific 2-thiouridylase
VELEVKHRAQERPVPARLEIADGGRARVTFVAPQAGVAPGQACVFYQGTRVLGGGWIDRAPLAADA